MKRLLYFLLLTLVACTNIEATETPAVVVTTTIIPTNTVLPPTPVPSVTPTETFTPPALCDPFREDYCIMEGQFIFQRPIQPPGNDLVDPGYRYGSTASGTRDPHHGVEFSNPSGTPVHAAGEGTVIFAGPDAQATYSPWQNFYGNLIVIEHQDEVFTFYAHLSKIDVEVDQKVLAGDKIGEVGWTGGAIGSHLHFEVRQGNAEDYFATQNPELWLVPTRDENGNRLGVLVISVLDGGGNLLRNANFTIGFYSDPSQSPVKVYYGATYSPDTLTGEENAVFGDLPAGRYRIAVEMNGQILDRWVEVESGKLTQVVFIVK